jgi:hypothetical protein
MDRHERIIIMAPENNLQLRGRIHLRGLHFAQRSPLLSSGGPYILGSDTPLKLQSLS